MLPIILPDTVLITVSEARPTLLYEAAPIVQGAVQPDVAPTSLDTVRALCHDLRQPLAAIRLLAGARGGDVQLRFDGILDQARWLTDLVEGVIGDAVDDQPARVDVIDLVSTGVRRAQLTTDCEIEFLGTDHAVAVAPPLALGRAFGSVLDNAIRAAGRGGHVSVEVTATAHQITVRIADDGPGFGHVPVDNSLGLTITRALVCSFDGGFELSPGPAGGMVAQLLVPALVAMAVATP